MDVFGRSGITPGQWNKGIHGKGLAYDAAIARRKAGGVAVFVTGDKELDAKLRALPKKLENKLIRQALRKSGKRVLEKFKAIVRVEAYETGAFMRAAKVRAMKRSRTRMGVTIHIDRDKYFADYEKRYGHKPRPAKGETEPFYVPAAIEFGTPTTPPVKPQRRALYENKDFTISEFRRDLTELVSEAAV